MMTQQRATTIWGPVADTDPLWRATLATAYSGPGDRPVVQKTHALRTLVQDAEPSTIQVDGAAYGFHRPRLLQAAVEARTGGWNELRLADGTTNAETVNIRDLGNQSAVFDDILLAPRDEPWAGKKDEMETPPFRLVAGRIRVWIPLAKRVDHSPAKDEPWLGYAKIGAEHRLFTDVDVSDDPINGLHVLAKSQGGTVYLPAELTSDGIAFFARVPDPLKAFNEAADKVWARVRLFETAASTRRRPLYRIAFEGACVVPVTSPDWSYPNPAPRGDHADALEAGFAAVFNDARTLGVRVDFDRRPAVPPFSFALETRIGGSRPTFPATGAGWTCLFDEALFRVNILSIIDGVPASATLKCENASLAITGTAAKIVLSSDDGSSGKRTVPLVRDHLVGHWQLGQLQAESLAAARLPLAAVEKRLTELYTASGLIDPAVDTTVPAFMPIEHGWLQVPLRDAEVTEAQAIERSVVDGTAAFALDDDRLRTLEISAASASKLTLLIKRGPPPSCERLSLVLDDTAGRLRGLVHIADCSPAGGEILPRLRAGATREWPVQFGQGDPGGAIGVVNPDPLLGDFSLVLAPGDPKKPETLVLSWQREGAWISTRNFAQTRGSGLPVAARSLVPRLVKTPCRLVRSAGRLLPSLPDADLGDVWDAFAAPVEAKPAYETTQLQPALPGIERHGLTANNTYSLRLDLPPLDDLFAAMQIEDAPLLRLGEKSRPDLGRTAALATAAAPGRLREAWRIICDNHRLTRTRYNFAFERGIAKVTFANLALPFEHKNVPFSFDLDNGKNLPLGRYFLDGAPFTGADALAGLSGNVDVTKSGQAVTIELQGNAAARWSPKRSDLRYDFAGTGIDAAPALARPVEILTAADSGDTVMLTTLYEPIPLEDDLMFWFRDIPFQNGAFDGRTGADGFVGNVDTRAPGSFARSLYEWRVWSERDRERAGDIALSHGFVARPLRLHRIVGDSSGVTQLELVASLLAPQALDAGRDSEAGETGPAQNLILITYDHAGGIGFKRSVVRVKVMDDAVKPFTAAEVAAGLDRARFEVRPGVDLIRQDNDMIIRKNQNDGIVFRDGTLTCTISPDGTIGETKLTLTLFGHAITFGRQLGSSYGGGKAAIGFASPAAGPGKIELRSARLSWNTDLNAEPAVFNAAPVINLPFAGYSGALTLGIDFAEGKIGWLGSKYPFTAKIDHDKAAITIKGAQLEGAPIIGLKFNQGEVLALFAVLDTLAVSGFAHISASFAPAEPPATLVLTHGFRSAAGAWSDELTLDMTGAGASSMQWPQDVVVTSGKRPEDEIAAVSTVRIAGGDALRHTLNFAIRGAAVPTTSLDAGGRLARPWHVLMRADHQLQAPNRSLLRWTSLDEVTIADLESLANQARASAASTPVYGFGARYSGIYRGHVSDKLPDKLRPGLFERGLIAAGFPDVLIREALAGAQPHGLALFGAGVSLFGLPSGQSVPLALPWLLGLEKADLGPLAELRQAPTPGATKIWSSAWYDARAARLSASPPGVPLALGDPSATVLARQIEPPSKAPPARPLLAAVEQPFFEDPAGKIAIAEAPLFLRSVVMLASAWSELSALGDAQSRLIQPLLRRDGTCALFAPSPGEPPIQRTQSLRLVCIDGTKTEFRWPRSDLDLPNVGAATSALLATLHGALGDRPLLFTVMAFSAFEEDGERLALWRDIEIPDRTIMASAWAEPEVPALRDASDRLFVSPTLGWPEAPSLRAGPDVLAMGENRPFQDIETAIAGRSAAFASTAGGGPMQRPWITFRLQPLFSAMALPSVMAAAPRQLDIAPRRPRLPPTARQPNIVPSRFAAIAVGYRSGTVHLAMTALKEAGTRILDPQERGVIAHRSHYHPVLAGQDRMPRATVLPQMIENLDWRRETFVLPRGPKCRIERVPAIAFRTYASVPEPGDVPPPRELVILKARDRTIDLTGGVALTLINEGALWPAWNPYTWRQFRLRIGTRSWPFKTLDAGGQITLTLETAAAAEAAALSLGATGDTVIACELILATSEKDADPTKPLAAPNLTLQLPLTIARVTEPVLTVSGATLVFGDPAYDRMLASMTASDTKRIDSQLAILATDRQTYDLASPVLVSLGLKAADGSISRPATYRLTIKRFRKGEKDSTQCVFDIQETMKVASLSIDLMVQSGLTSVLPGDRLTLSADFDLATVPYSLSLQLSITREPAVPPAPAIYHLLTLHGVSQANLDAATALSASGPTCEIVEYPALEADLMAGYVRRRGLFVWPFAPDEQPYFDRFGYLVKLDWSGAGQLPAELADFEAAIALPSFDSKSQQLLGPKIVTAFAVPPAQIKGGTVAKTGKRVKSGKAGRTVKPVRLQDAPKPARRRGK